MLEISNKKDQVVLKDQKITQRVKFSNLENCTIQNVDFSSNESDHMVNASNLKNCKFINCKFHDKSTIGVACNMSGPGTSGNIFDGCEWYNLTYSAGNGGEPLRLGNSQYSGIWFNCTVRNCNFHDLKADVETISIKSCGNTVENCTFSNNQSNITVRHGGFAKIINNKFFGSGGIRLYGYGTTITGNTFKDNQSDSKFAPIIIGAGTEPKDPNFTAPDKPSGKEGRSHATYAQVNTATIEKNVFDNCKVKVYVRTDHPLRAVNSRIVDQSEGPTTPPPPPPEPEPTPDIAGILAKIDAAIAALQDARKLLGSS